MAAKDGTGDTGRLRAEIAALRTELENLRRQRDADLDSVLREIAHDRQRLWKLEHPEEGDPTCTEIAHLQRIEKHLKDSSRHAASFARSP